MRKQLTIVNSQKEEFIKNYLVNSCNNNDQTQLVETLKNYTDHLKIELLSKDKIISMLLDDSNKTLIKRNILHDTVTNNIQNNITPPNDAGNSVLKTDDENKFEDVRTKKKKNKREIVILGDSITKNIERHKMKKELRPHENIYIKSFPGAVISDMYDYSRPSKNLSPDLFILHVGTNELRSSKTAEEISKELLNLALDLNTNQNEVMVSSIIKRDDKWNAKGQEVNGFLSSKCSELGLGFIDNHHISTNHLNGSGLHLNFNGTIALARNFLRSINL